MGLCHYVRFYFCETGLVVTPVLPGDSMIFAAAAYAARNTTSLNVHWIAVLMIIAAFSGDTSWKSLTTCTTQRSIIK